MLLDDLPLLLATAIPLLMSLSVHEFAHARVALAFGDPTAKLLGRCTLNPLVHLDPIGTLCLIFAGFGWAKPVPVNYANLYPPRKARIMVSVAGPGSNLALALAIGVVLRASLSVPDIAAFFETQNGIFLGKALYDTMLINIILCVFNLMPLFPLDGHHILRELLPPHQQMPFMQFQVRYGQFLVLAVIFAPRLLNRPGLITYVVYHTRWVLQHVFPEMFT